jgi:hypothetical protein
MAVLSSLIFLFFSAVLSQHCNWTDPVSGARFDLSSLTLQEGFYEGSSEPYLWKLDVCHVVPDTSACAEELGVLCQFDNGDYMSAWATWGRTDQPEAYPQWSVIDDDPTRGVQLNFTNGYPYCQNQGRRFNRSSLIKFLCTPGKTDTMNFTIVEDNPCFWIAQLESQYACAETSSPEAAKLSIGSILLIVLVVAIPLYILIGCIYNTKKHQTKGTDSCPNVEFWRDLPALVRDGCRFTFRGCKKGTGNAYEEL